MREHSHWSSFVQLLCYSEGRAQGDTPGQGSGPLAGLVFRKWDLGTCLL